ncbi:MAG TPA: DNA mismatch repair protein MutS, partial [Acetobacteraceae bacterium]|nr:DNA mismatch repair protein MutS [Acetobacteraceae bacterium]
ATALDGPLPALLAGALIALTPDPTLQQTLADALTDPAPLRLDDTPAIRPGFDPALDAERALRDDSRRVLATLQLGYAQRYGVASLKIRHHAQLGYVIEAPAAAVEKLREQPDLTLRQGMANGARFTSPELSELDRRIAEAGERAAARERAVFAHLVQTALDRAEPLAACAEMLAMLDVAQSAARLAQSGTWCRPAVADSTEYYVQAGRHPVVQAALSGQAAFVPNDCDLSPERRVLLLTGPNMAGKSTFLRQNALLVVLAQAGLPVPAEAARLGVVDRLFSRVGGGDDLARGRSTFMVEMTEAAAILHQAGPRSLVVVDEIGRGTATLDGLAIAWAVLEALHGAIRCRTIFATHFHELAELADRMSRLKPHTMRVKEWKQSVVFLHEVAEGAAGRSWGVHVAELAGVPAPVVRRAAALLAALERHGGPLGAAGPLAALPLFVAAASPEPPDDRCSWQPDPLAAALAELDPDRLTPREALDALYRLKSLLPVSGAELS